MPPEPGAAARRALVTLSAALATRDAHRVHRALADAREAADAVAVEEVILQAHLFVGFPDMLNALAAWREVSRLPASPSLDDDPAGWEARGAEVCATVYGANYDKLRRNVAALHPTWTAGWRPAATAASSAAPAWTW
jgi:4-carboxymuconolactone decarboxylase